MIPKSRFSHTHIATLHLLPSITAGILRRMIVADDVSYPLTAEQWTTLGAEPPRVTKLLAESERVTTDHVATVLRRNTIYVLTQADDAYPPLLREIPSPPPVLYVRGNIAVLKTTSLAVVGTRLPTPYGKDVTKNLVATVGRAGLTIVSGLAYGIDAVAHIAALTSGAPTVAVLGSGVNTIYPGEHDGLAQDIIAHGGAVISEFPLGARPERHHFPQRNRIISGLSKAVLLIEAGHKSGALITAKFAVDQNREVLAIPGLITSPQSIGPHNWLKLGAKLVTSADDILEVYTQLHFSGESGAGYTMKQSTIPDVSPMPTSDDPVEMSILTVLHSGPHHIDEIIKRSRLDTSAVTVTISLLEIRDVIEHTGGMNYRLK